MAKKKIRKCLSHCFHRCNSFHVRDNGQIINQIRNSLKYVPYTDRKELANDLKTVYKASTEETRKIMYTTNAIESLNSTYKRINKNRNVFPTDMSLLKVLYLSTVRAEKNGQWLTSGTYVYLNLKLCMKVEYKNSLK